MTAPMTAPMSEPTSPLVFRDAERPSVPFDGGASYRVLIGDDNGAGIAVRTGVQTSQPGYATPEHSHPYAGVITVLSGRGEAWLAGQPARHALEPGMTIVFPADTAHGFRVTGNEPLVTLGIHANGQRIVTTATGTSTGPSDGQASRG